MENIMNSCQSQRESNYVSHWAIPFKYLKGPNISGTELPTNSKSPDPLRRRDFQEDMISNLELQVSPSSISIAPLSTLGRLKMSSY